MAWKIERWLDELFPGESAIYDQYRLLPPRELVIVAASVLDAALAELLHSRFRDESAESESFLGASGDGRAPAGSFGARIQLALLLGLITPADVGILRALKNLRNTFAHRASADFRTAPALRQTQTLLNRWKALSQRLRDAGVLGGDETLLDEYEAYLTEHHEAGAGLVLAVFCTYQAYFHRLTSLVSRKRRPPPPTASG